MEKRFMKVHVCHLHDVYKSTLDDLLKILSRAKSHGVKRMMLTSTTLEDLNGNLSLIEHLQDEELTLSTTVGVHPTRCMDLENDPSMINGLLEVWRKNRDKISAIGEFGLDYDRLDFCEKDVQKK